MPEKLKSVTLGQWIATGAFLLNLAAYGGTQLTQKARTQAVLEALAVKVTETKLALDDHTAKSDNRHTALWNIVNDHEKRLYYQERKTQ